MLYLHIKWLHLREKYGWNKIREAEDISVWIYDKHDRKFGMFVPLSDDFVDYRQRTIGVLETIQQVEDRSTFEICPGDSGYTFTVLKHPYHVFIYLTYFGLRWVDGVH
jgi:hypothetical protein